MAWSVLQSVSTVNSGGANVAATFTTANLTSGSKVICWLCADTSTGGTAGFTAVSDGTNALSKLGAFFDTGGTLEADLWVMDTPAGDAGTKPTITATWNTGLATSYGFVMLLQEVTGLAAGNTTAILDGAAIGAASGNSASAASGAYSSGAASEYLTAAYFDPGTGVTIATPPSGYTADPHNVSGQSSADLSVYYKNSSAGAESATFGLSGSGQWEVLLTAFKLASGPAFIPAPARAAGQAVNRAACW